ncbi:hypothetical protein KKA85_14050 [bacterium]|nr:hypothetical protein [bacterium]MBU1676887.1 hypothetical protein [bacterium]
MKRIVLPVALIGLLAAGSAFAGNPIGVRAGLSSSPDQFFVGGQMYLTELSPDLWLVPKVDAGFGDDFTFIYVFGTVLYSFSTTDMGGFTPYAGGGAGLTFWSWEVPAGWSGVVDDSGSEFGITGIAGLKKRMESGKELGFELEIGLSDYTADFKAGAYLNFF